MSFWMNKFDRTDRLYGMANRYAIWSIPRMSYNALAAGSMAGPLIRITHMYLIDR